MKSLWQQVMPDIVADIKSILIDVLLTKMQPRWTKGMAGVIATHAIVSLRISLYSLLTLIIEIVSSEFEESNTQSNTSSFDATTLSSHIPEMG